MTDFLKSCVGNRTEIPPNEADITKIGNSLHPDMTLSEVMRVAIDLINCISDYGNVSNKHRKQINTFTFFLMRLFQKFSHDQDIAKVCFIFVRFQCRVGDDNRIAFGPFIPFLVNLLKSYSENPLILEDGLRAIGNVSLPENNAIAFNRFINEIIGLLPAYIDSPRIMEAGICALRGIARPIQNKAIFGLSIPLFIRVLKEHIGHKCIVQESLSLVAILLRNSDNQNNFRTHIPFLMEVCQHYINIHTDSVLILFWELSFKNEENKIILIPYMDILFSAIYGPKQLPLETIKFGIGAIDCISRNQSCGVMLYNYTEQILGIITRLISQKEINLQARRNFIAYGAAAAKSKHGDRPLKKVKIEKKSLGEQGRSAIVLSQMRWKMHISSFISEEVTPNMECDIVSLGLTAIWMIIKFRPCKDDFAPYLDRVMVIVRNYCHDIRVASRGIGCIIEFIFTGMQMGQAGYLRINMLVKHHLLIKKINSVSPKVHLIMIIEFINAKIAGNKIKKWWQQQRVTN